MNRLLVHPHFNSSGRINSVRVLVSGKRVRMEASENVPDPAARDGLDYAAALPHPERHLEVLASPDVHFFVVGVDVPEILSVDGEQTTSHRWSCYGSDRISLAVVLNGLGNVDPEYKFSK